MRTKFEKYLVEQCAPTLAGIKTGCLFHYTAEENEDLTETIRFWSQRLFEKGVRIRLVRENPNGGLVYVFRPSLLARQLSDKETDRFLETRGYADCHDPDTYVHRLQRRLCSESCFPHEIGIFLGYPLRDVRGFIENKGKNFSLCGLWKVYGEQSQAERLFARFKKCKSIYKSLFEKGSTVLKLTVAA